MKSFVCRHCKVTFTVNQSKQFYCSRKCAFASRHKTLEEKFWAKVDKSAGHDGCWLWTGSTNNVGYGKIGNGTRASALYAHRLSWAWANGRPVPDGLFVCHRCDVRNCVNPDHLFVGTQRENMDDMLAKGREQHGENHAFARLTSDAVREIRRRLAAGEQRSSVAGAFGITRVHLHKIEHRILWKHVA